MGAGWRSSDQFGTAVTRTAGSFGEPSPSLSKNRNKSRSSHGCPSWRRIPDHIGTTPARPSRSVRQGRLAWLSQNCKPKGRA